MRIFRDLWHDEFGVILSAELVILGTVGVVGLTTGLSMVSQSVNGELQDLAFAMRSLDQSYNIPGQQCCVAYTAGSCCTQEPVEESLAILCNIAEKEDQIKKEDASKAERLEKQIQKKEAERRKNKKQEDL